MMMMKFLIILSIPLIQCLPPTGKLEDSIHGGQSACSPSPCGLNGVCRATRTRAVCSCPVGFQGDPYTRCDLNPCQESKCGANAECTAHRSKAVCKCVRGYIGDPFKECHPGPCQNSPCGENAHCTLSGSRAVCKCWGGYIGDPFTRCRLDPCNRIYCGINAECDGVGCKCREGYEGDPFVQCKYSRVIEANSYLPTILNVDGPAIVAGLGWNDTWVEQGDTKVYRPTPSATWEVLYPHNCSIPSLPFGVTGAVAMSTEDTILVCGGQDENRNVLRTCHSLQDGEWTSAPSMLESRIDAAQLITENGWMVAGGKDNSGKLLDSMEIYRDGAWSRMPWTLPEPAQGHCLVQLNATTLFVTGGYIDQVSGSGKTYSYQASMLNMETGEWTRVEDMKMDRAWHQCFKMGNGVVVAGRDPNKQDPGIQDPGYLLQRVGENSDRFIQIAYLLAGDNIRDTKSFVEVFDLATEQWGKERDLPEFVDRAGSVYVGDEVVIVGAGKDDDKILRMSWTEEELLVTQLIGKNSELKDGRSGGVVLKVNKKLLNCGLPSVPEICGATCIEEAFVRGNGQLCCGTQDDDPGAYCCQTLGGQCIGCIA